MSTHTPGPWMATIEQDDPELPLAVRAGDVYVATPHLGVPGSVVANARLIAAAPDLLAALKGLVACCTSSEGAISPEPACRGEWLDCMVDARAAIAKAEGR